MDVSTATIEAVQSSLIRNNLKMVHHGIPSTRIFLVAPATLVLPARSQSRWQIAERAIIALVHGRISMKITWGGPAMNAILSVILNYRSAAMVLLKQGSSVMMAIA
jgi:hypothetical protein